MQELDINTLIFNNCNMLEEFGVVVEDFPSIPYAEEDYETYDSKYGSIIFNKGSYKDITITFNLCLVHFKDNFWDKMDKIEDWLNDIEDNRLFYSRLDRHWIVKKVIKNNIKRNAFLGEGEFQVSFICSPFQYTDEAEIEITEPTDYFYYVGNINSLPDVEIYGTGTIELIFNDNILRINNVRGRATIKGELMEVLDENKNNLENDGDFPYLQKGDNSINFNRNVEKIILRYKAVYK